MPTLACRQAATNAQVKLPATCGDQRFCLQTQPDGPALHTRRTWLPSFEVQHFPAYCNMQLVHQHGCEIARILTPNFHGHVAYVHVPYAATHPLFIPFNTKIITSTSRRSQQSDEILIQLNRHTYKYILVQMKR